ncbi:MAG: hypothetical protein IPJ43_21375 [Saprospiraceae bacterium]|nr:hypothetical protein [Saprospiraceae bacterium]
MILIPAIYILGISIAGIDAQQMQDVSQSMPNAQQVVVNEDEIVGAIREIGNLNWWRIVPVFILYFLGGYFIYLLCLQRLVRRLVMTSMTLNP